MTAGDILHEGLSSAQLVDQLRGLRPVLSKLGVSGLALFGSRARGDNREDSDVDLIVDVDGVRKFSLLDLIGVEHAIADRIGLPVSVFLRRSLDAGIAESARREEMVVFRD